MKHHLRVNGKTACGIVYQQANEESVCRHCIQIADKIKTDEPHARYLRNMSVLSSVKDRLQ